MKIYSVICLVKGERPYVCCSFTSLHSAKDFVRSVCPNFSHFSIDENGLSYSFSLFTYYIQCNTVYNFGGQNG